MEEREVMRWEGGESGKRAQESQTDLLIYLGRFCPACQHLDGRSLSRSGSWAGPWGSLLGGRAPS